MSSLVAVPCPICGSNADFLPLRITKEDAHIDKYGDLYAGVEFSAWKACGACGFVHQNPRPSLAALSEFYLHGDYHPPELPADVDVYMRFARWYFAEKVDYAIRNSGLARGRVLEIGSGLGGALALFAERGWETVAIEPDAAQAQFSRERLQLSGVRHGLVDDSFDLDQPVDLVFSNHAFEHFADLNAIMSAVSRVLRPGGFIFTAVPTYYSNRSRLSKLWMNSAHYSLFTHQTLNQLFARHGLNEVCHTYRGWRKEIDDIWHVARFDGRGGDPARYFQSGRGVQRYVNVYNPMRSFIFAPFFAEYARRVAFAERVKAGWNLLRRSPSDFARRLLGAAAREPRKG